MFQVYGCLLLAANSPDVGMITLQGLGPAMPFTEGGNALDCCHCGGNGGDIGDFILDRRLADVGIVVLAELAAGGIDDQVNGAVFDGIDNIRPSLVHLEQGFRGDAFIC